ncbi:protein fuzzy homolog isoform X1 [Orussus abietinus]|uniref:protein fuzzy homolog isoform X1 n=1 Tax=Orussus abietinus TaxID=222816 RepID=UPI0006256771|nr:protein fuzzy homolog isoform X1 [Orussus abietinus]
MAAHVMCLTSAGGIPVFTRRKGEGEMMTFSKMASLNGVHMFLKSQNADLLVTYMPDTTVVWKEFEGCITLIVMASGTTKYVLDKFLTLVFNAMVLVAGIDEIKNPRNLERLKKDLRVCNPIIDKLLECLDIGDRIGSKTDLIDMTESIMYTENHLFQTCLDAYMESLDSMYGCLLVHGCLAVATECWWTLDTIERKLLIAAMNSDSNYTARDMPVFLPYKSPNVAFRLVSVTLVNHIEVLALCGTMPELPEIERLAIQCWRSSIDILRTSELYYPRNFPVGTSLDSGILGFLLANYKVEKFVLSRNSQHSKNRITGAHRLDTLRTFYYQAVETFMLLDDTQEANKERSTNCSMNPTSRHNSEGLFHGAKETYWCSEYHKCHALKDDSHIFCVLYTSTIPTHTMRLITQKTLKTLLADKLVCW